LDRPLGVKKAKRQQLLEKLDGHSTPAMRSLDVNNRAMQSMDETQRFKSAQVALSMRFQMLMQVGRTAEACAIIDIMKEEYDAEKRRPRVEIPEDHKLPSVLVAQKTQGPSPLTVEGLADPKNQFKSLDGEDSDAVDMLTKKPAAKAQDSSSNDEDSLSVPPSLRANPVKKTRAAIWSLKIWLILLFLLKKKIATIPKKIATTPKRFLSEKCSFLLFLQTKSKNFPI
jgi:hypothetical protein